MGGRGRRCGAPPGFLTGRIAAVSCCTDVVTDCFTTTTSTTTIVTSGGTTTILLICLVDKNGFKYARSVMKVFLQQLGGYFAALQLPQETAKSQCGLITCVRCVDRGQIVGGQVNVVQLIAGEQIGGRGPVHDGYDATTGRRWRPGSGSGGGTRGLHTFELPAELAVDEREFTFRQRLRIGVQFQQVRRLVRLIVSTLGGGGGVKWMVLKWLLLL